MNIHLAISLSKPTYALVHEALDVAHGFGAQSHSQDFQLVCAHNQLGLRVVLIGV